MNEFLDRFLNDYYAECEEHLTAIRRALLDLEASIGQPRPDARVTEEGKLYWTVVGEGEIDYAGHFLALAKAGYDGVLALETHYRTPDGDAEKASRECLDGMKRLIAEATTKAAAAIAESKYLVLISGLLKERERNRDRFRPFRFVVRGSA